ncbi:MAG: cation:proton antiporter [Steroidobacteraceae bacterium]
MIDQPLSQVLLLLAAAVFVVALARRLGWPAILGYLAVGILLGPHALGLMSENNTTRLLAELGVVFLLFTLGLEFSWPRMVAMRHEVFGLGALQVALAASFFAGLAIWSGVPWLAAIVLGGALSMSSTALVVAQLTEQAELNRSHGRFSFSILLFQDLAFVPFLAIAAVLSGAAEDFSLVGVLRALLTGGAALIVVLLAGRWLLRPLLYEIAHSRLRELFTMTVILVVLASAWATHLAGLSMAMGAFLAGMMLAETEYRHQVDAVIRPFRDILLGLFFISVGMLLDIGLVLRQFWLVMALLATFMAIRGLLAGLATRPFTDARFKAARTGIVMSGGGEFGVALLTILIQGHAIDRGIGSLLLVVLVASMIATPFVLRNNRRIARLIMREQGPPPIRPADRETAATQDLARREHVILCGFGRVGQNVARVLERHGFEYVALDLDPTRIRAARQAGDPVMYGDSADEDVIKQVGLDTANAVVITFANPATSLAIIATVRAIRADVPILVRTQDDARLTDLRAAGATEVVPETFEASLMLVSQVLMLLHVPVGQVVRTVGDIRNNRYAVLRSIFRRDDALQIDETHEHREELKSIVLPPKAWSVGRTLEDVRGRGAEVAFTAVRRNGILGREPAGGMQLREGDIVVVYGEPEALEHAEAVLLAG